MRIVLFGLVVALASCTSSMGLDAVDATSRTQAIINGHACDATEDPTAVAVLVDATLAFQGSTVAQVSTIICTGTLIAPDVVLTAAHCTDPSLLAQGTPFTVSDASYFVSFDADLSALADPNGQGKIPDDAIAVKKLERNEDFDINAFNTVNGPGEFHDIGILFLDKKVTTVEPEIVIGKDEIAALKQGASVNIAGWGEQEPQANPQAPPPAGSVAIKQCGDTTLNELGDAEMQIGSDDTSIRKCHGDSGGPTYIDVGGKHARTKRVIGITSHAYDQSDCAKGGVDTRVDVWIDWLDGKMKAACADGTRTACDVPGVIPASFYDPKPAPTPTKPVTVKKGCAQTDASTYALGVLGLAALSLARRRRR